MNRKQVRTPAAAAQYVAALAETDYYTTEEVAAIFRLSPSTIRTWRERGQGPQGWIRGKRRKALIRKSIVHSYLASEEFAVDIYAA